MKNSTSLSWHRTYNLLRQIKSKWFNVIVILNVIVGVYFVQGQPGDGTLKPRPITDKVPYRQPEKQIQGNNYSLIFKNKEGEVYKEERYGKGDVLFETRHVEELHANGKPAKEIIVTGTKDKDGLDAGVTKQQEIYFDEKGNKIKTETYTDFKDGVAREKVVTENGRTTTYASTNGKWEVVLYPPSPSGRPTNPLGGSGIVPASGHRVPISNSEARRIIQGYLDEIARRQKYMTENYYWVGAEKTVLKAFEENGIDSPGHAHTWSGAMALTWSQMAKRYYESHWSEFNSTLKLVAEKRCVAGTDVELLDAGFKKWEAGDKEVEGEFRKIINSYVLESKNLQARDNYLKIYNAQYDSLSAQRPYPSGQIKVLNDAKNVVVGKSETDYKALEANEDVIAKRITEISTTLVFKATTNMQPCGPVK